MPDDIAYWKQERDKLQKQLSKLEAGVVEYTALPVIQYLKTRIAELERHIASLEVRRT